MDLNPEQHQQWQITESLIRDEISQNGGALPFDQFMELALYAPRAGYYVNGKRKLGAEGDFVTAPEISAVFSQCLAAQCAQVLDALDDTAVILEFGAGSGVMAADILLQLALLDKLPAEYWILELSSDLQALQKEIISSKVPQLLSRVQWLSQLPKAGWKGVVVANELLDAMPVHRFMSNAGGWDEMFVINQEQGFSAQWQTAQSVGLTDKLDQIVSRKGAFSEGYFSEINLRLSAWLKALSDNLLQGAVILADYGYSETEYYHPDREMGTLICHFQHQAFDDALQAVGLQDITANVDFTAVAREALEAGFELAGYTTQTHFLISTGMDEILAAADQSNALAFMQQVQGVKMLTLPSEMGERFKFIGLTKSMDISLQGFSSRDMREYL